MSALPLSVPFVLASRSPRRRYLLEMLGVDFTVQASDVDEIVPPGEPPAAVVESLARQKAEAVAPDHPTALTLGADTVVVLDEAILGQPSDADEAHEMIRRLAGRTHVVYSGIALVHAATARVVTAHEATHVTFAHLSDEEIAQYVATGSPMDKAGAYGIQDDRGALFVERIEGDYYNVVGLPLHRLYRTLHTHFPTLVG